VKTEHIVLIAVGVLLLTRSHARAQAAATVEYGDPSWDGSNWYEDAWARLHGRDLSIDGNHGAPSGYDAYGLTNAMGWNYGWDGSITGAR